MNASWLVEERKAGKLTQEQFFIQLNELRRVHYARTRLGTPDHGPTADAEPGARSAGGIKGSEEDANDDAQGVKYIVEHSASTSDSWDSGQNNAQAATSIVNPSFEQGPLPGDGIVSRPAHTQMGPPGHIASMVGDNPCHRGMNCSSLSVLHKSYGEDGTQSDRLPAAEKTSHILDRIESPSRSPQLTQGAEPREMTSAILYSESNSGEEGVDDTPWFASPRGENDSPPRVRKTFSDWKATCPTLKSLGCTGYNRVDWVGLSPRGSRGTCCLANHKNNPQARNQLQTARQKSSQKPLCQVDMTSLLSRSRDKQQDMDRTSELGEDILCLKHSRLQKASEGRASVMTQPEGVRHNALSSSQRVRESTHVCARPVPEVDAPRHKQGAHGHSNVDASDSNPLLSVQSQNKHSPRSLHDKHPRCASEGVGAASSGLQGSVRRVFRRDRYGYPLHKKGGLESCQRDNTNSALFTPIVKDLPQFYHTRPKRSVDCFGWSGGSDMGPATKQSESLYKRTMSWRERMRQIRVHKLALLEMRELDGCTFQPNARQHSKAPCYRNGDAHQKAGTCKDGVGATSKGQSRDGSTNVCARLLEAGERSKERRAEAEERKRMSEEEAFARDCTFKPSLLTGPTCHMHGVRSRFRDVENGSSSVKLVPGEIFTFRPQVLGVKPGMTRAEEYVSLDVSKRLSGDHPTRRRTGTGVPVPTSRSGPEQYDACPEREGRWHCTDDSGRFEYHTGVNGPNGSRCEDDGDEGSLHDATSSDGKGHLGGDERWAHCVRCRSENQSADGVDPRNLSDANTQRAVIRQRPQSVPASKTAAHEQSWRDHPEERGGRDMLVGAVERCGGARVGLRRHGRHQLERRSRCQVSITFSEFLGRQAHSQELAKQRLRRLTWKHSPSFTPQLSRGSLRIMEKHGGSTGTAARGSSFEDRLNMTARRRQRNRKVAKMVALSEEQEGCTFSPELTSYARMVRSRSVRELSIGDAVLKQAKQRLARAREESKLQAEDSGDNVRGFGFKPQFANTRQTPSRLRLADGLDTYLERFKGETNRRDRAREGQRRQALEEELRACTFRPSLKPCPELVKRTAEGMRRIREFRQNEALFLASSEQTQQQPPAKEKWR